jgi:hypothetical protein
MRVPTSLRIAAGALLILATTSPVAAAPFDSVSTELANDDVDLTEKNLENEDVSIPLIEGGGILIQPAVPVPEVRRDLC